MKKFENKAEFEDALIYIIWQRMILGQDTNLPTGWWIADAEGDYKVDIFSDNYKRSDVGEWPDDEETVEIIKVCIQNLKNKFIKIIPILRNPYNKSRAEFELNGIHYWEQDGELKNEEF